MKALSLRQKSVLCQVARRAFDLLRSKGQLSGVTFDDWRRDECERAVGKPGLRFCGNSDYNGLLARFNSLAGEDGRAMNAYVREQSEKHRQVEAVLVREMEAGGFGPAYVDAICKAQFKCSVLDAKTDQILKLIYTIRNRAAAKRRVKCAPNIPQRP
ncbi:MAG: hypothetical protein QOF48_1516 [Verrucomicrobiota bacterium]|jgi:hypothetical protein